jgi:hypothetical protein
VLTAILIALGIMLGSPWSAAPTQAQGPIPDMAYPVRLISQEDRNNDGRPDVTTLALSVFNIPDLYNDYVRVYDGGGDMEAGTDWRQVTDFENDIWIFDVSNNGDAQLIMRFERQGRLQQAKFFTDQDADGKVSHFFDQAGVLQINEGQGFFQVTSNPTISAEALDGWFLPSGELNWNVVFRTDGPNFTLIDERDFSSIFTLRWERYMKYDGLPDTELEFHDSNFDGIPEYGMLRLRTSTPMTEGLSRTWMWHNKGLKRPQVRPTFYFWPYLSYSEWILAGNTDTVEAATARRQTRQYFDEPPRLEVLWTNAAVSRVLFKGYPIEHGHHVNTMQYIDKGTTNYVDFEVGQYYYDMAEDADRAAELHIRHRYFARDQIFGWGLPVDLSEIRWSWNQANADGLKFDFKLGLGGRVSVQEQINLPDFAYYGVPYEQMPDWVLRQDWDIVTLVAMEAAPFASAEGIYAWGAIEAVVDQDPSRISRYLAGQVTTDVRRGFSKLDSGMRGEVSENHQESPALYLSAIDRKLHLVGADYCLWNIDGASELRCENLTNDNYLDHWIFSTDGVLVRQLYHVKDLLIYQEGTTIIIKQLEVAPSVFEVPPPTNYDTWLALSDLLAEQPALTPGDLLGMFNQHPGPTWQITDTQMGEFRLTDTGFRFIMDVLPDYLAITQFEVGNLQALCVGRFLVEYRDGGLIVKPMTPPDIDINSLVIKDLTGATATQTQILQQVQIDATLINQGLEDARNLWIRIYTEQGEDVSLLGEGEWDLNGDASRRAWTVWSPGKPGDWTVRFKVFDRTNADDQMNPDAPSEVDPGELIAEKATTFTVLPARTAVITLLGLAGDQPLGGVLSLLLLLATGGVAMALFILIFVPLRSPTGTPAPDKPADGDTPPAAPPEMKTPAHE